MGPCAGGDVYSPAMTDFIFMVRDTSYMFVTGPDVVKTVTNETVTAEQLGGAKVHTTKSSVADGSYENDVEMLLQTRRLIDFLAAEQPGGRARMALLRRPAARGCKPRHAGARQSLQAYDIKELILKVADEGDFFESSPHLPRTSSRDFGRHRGRTVGFVANHPWFWPACWRCGRHAQGARFVRFCDASNPDRSPSWTCPASCPAPRRNMAASSSMGRSCCSPIPRRPCRSSPHHPQGLRRRL